MCNALNETPDRDSRSAGVLPAGGTTDRVTLVTPMSFETASVCLRTSPPDSQGRPGRNEREKFDEESKKEDDNTDGEKQ